MDDHTSCAMCGRLIKPGSGYVVRIDVFADPELPPLASDNIEAANLNAAIAQAIEEARHLSAQELQDGIHRRFEYPLCPTCHRDYLGNPLGLPRQARVGKN